MKSNTKYPLYSHQNPLTLLIYIILINPTWVLTNNVRGGKKEKGGKKTVFERRISFIPDLAPSAQKYLRIPSKNVKFGSALSFFLLLLGITYTHTHTHACKKKIA